MPDQPVMAITGTSKGIGRYLVEYYLNKGFQVVGCSRGSPSFEFPGYQHFCLDVSDEEEVKRMFVDIRKKYQRLDVLINNAGIASMNHVLLTPVKVVKDILDTNYVGASSSLERRSN